MATYQEQIEKNAKSLTATAMVACHELSHIAEAMSLLERDGIIDAEARIAFCKAFVLKHPEINQALKRHGDIGG